MVHVVLGAGPTATGPGAGGGRLPGSGGAGLIVIICGIIADFAAALKPSP